MTNIVITATMQLVLASALATLVASQAPNCSAEPLDHRNALLEREPNYPMATSFLAARYGYVPTNTLAFREYALDLLLEQANTINEKWKLGLPNPVTVDDVTRFTAVPLVTGMDGSLTLNERFAFRIEQGRLHLFRDQLYCSDSWALPSQTKSQTETKRGPVRQPIVNDDLHRSALTAEASRNKAYNKMMLELAGMTNSLTQEKALAVAKKALHNLGFTEEQLHLSYEPSVVSRNWLALFSWHFRRELLGCLGNWLK